MVVTVLKNSYNKLKPKEIHYRSYKLFNRNDFRNDLRVALANTSTYDKFEGIYLDVLDKHAPMKTKTVRANVAPYMTKTLRKAIMRRTALKNKLIHGNSPGIKEAYKKQKKNTVVNNIKKKENVFITIGI